MQEGLASIQGVFKNWLRDKKYLYRPAVLIIALLAGAAIVAPFYLSRYERAPNGQVLRLIVTHDLVMHLPQAQVFDKVLRTGILYPRWLADVNSGYGIATMNFYPPITFYLYSLFHAIFGDWTNGLFALSILGFAGSGLSCYLFARLFLGKVASAIASLFYMALPFHVMNLYWQGAIGQFLSYVFMPLVLYFVYQVGKHGLVRHYAALGFFYGIFLLTNFPIALLFSYTLVFYTLVWAAKRRDWKIVFRIAMGMALGVLLSAIYWLPAALEAKYMYEWASQLFPYHTTYLTLLTVYDEFGWRLNTLFVLHLLALMVSLIVLRTVGLKDSQLSEPASEARQESDFQLRLWVIMSIATIFMSTSFSIYISKLIPKIEVALPAWRWLVPASLFTALLVGAAVERLLNRAILLPKRRLAYSVIFAIALIANLWFSVQYIIIGALSNPTYSPAPMYIDSGFTPKGSTPPDRLPDTPQALLQPETGTVRVIRWDPQDREIFVQASAPVTLRLRTYNFPGWVARIDDQAAPVFSDKDGAQLIEVPAGTHIVEASFVNTPPRNYGTILSALGLLTIIGLTIVGKRRRKQQRTVVRDQSAVAEDQLEDLESNIDTNGLARSESNEAPEPSVRRWLDKRTKRIAMFSLLILAGIFVLVIATRLFRTRENTASPSNTSTPAGSGSVGSQAKLQVQGLASIMVAIDENALNELMNALPTRDESKIEDLVQSGKVFRVASGTSVLIMEFGFAKTKVKIFEGEFIRKEGWVPEGWIKY